MKEFKINVSEERAMREFEEELARGEWDDDMTDEEIDAWSAESAAACDEFEKRIANDKSLNVVIRECDSPYGVFKLRREDYNND